MFSKGSSSSISLAMVTPSLVISGEPNFLSSTTLRPFGPRVIFTVFASVLIPASSARRASSPYLICFAIIFPPIILNQSRKSGKKQSRFASRSTPTHRVNCAVIRCNSRQDEKNANALNAPRNQTVSRFNLSSLLPHPQGASRHHDGAATGKMGTHQRLEPPKILNRFPIQNRRDQTRQQSSAGTARRFPIQFRRDQTRQQVNPTQSATMARMSD